MGGGSILGGLILGAIGALIVDRNYMKAGWFALAGAIMTFFGFMHGEKIGIGQTPVVAVSYLMVSGILMACAKLAAPAPVPAAEAAAEEKEFDGEMAEAH